MSGTPLRFKVTLTLAAPLLSHSSGALDYGLDAATRRDSQGRPALPGSLIKGNLRHAWLQLQALTGSPQQSHIDSWLGQPSPPDSNDAPSPARLRFSRDWSDLDWQPEQHAGRRFRIQIDPNTGAVADGALQVIDSPYPAGAELRLSGSIAADIGPDDDAAELQRLIDKGLRLVPAFGALKGSGFGRLLEVAIETETAPHITPDKRSGQRPPAVPSATNSQPGDAIGLRIRPGEPFCFARPAVGGGNHFEAESHIPGAAIKAAIARRTQAAPGRWPLLEQQLSALQLSHALPVPSGESQRPLVLPLSLVEAAGDFHDIAGDAQPGLIRGEAPLFNIDWKPPQWDAASRLYNPLPAQPQRLLDIRTAINAATGSAADGELFSMETVAPQGCDWLSNLYPGEALNADQTQQLQRELADLASAGLSHLGKTKASASLTLEPAYPYTRPQQAVAGDSVTLHLQTPARLLPADLDSCGSNDGDTLQQAYASAWQALSGGALELQRFFASQRLLGGTYWRNRFCSSGQAYQPQLFTQPGSVFVLAIKDADAADALLQRWQQQGLPQLADAPGGEDWQRNPWISANGYGEIALNIHPANGGEA